MALSFRTFKNNFSSGEITPRMQGRSELSAYANGALTMTNVLPRPQGGFRRRGGSVFGARAKYRDKECRLIPYRFSVTQSYIIELGEGYMRFFTNRGRLEVAGVTITNAVDNGSGEVRITAGTHGLVTGDYTAIRLVQGTTEANDDWQVTVIDPNTFDLDGSVFANTYVSGGTSGEIIELATPWQEADLAKFRFVQDENTMYCVHPDYWPYLVTRTSASTFTATKIDNVLDAAENIWIGGPFQDWNDTTTHTMNWGSGTLTVGTTASMISSTAYFDADMVGMFFKYGGLSGGAQGYLRCTVFNSTTDMTMVVVSQLSTTAATDAWALGSWGEYTGFPAEVGFYEQRLILARTLTEPGHLWASKVGAVFNFEVVTGAVNETWVAKIFSTELNVIQWVLGHDALLIGTGGGEFALTTVTTATPPIALKQQSAYGSAEQAAVKIGSSVLYAQRAGRRVYDLNFSLEADKYLGTDLALRAEHIFRDDPIKHMAFQLSPEPITWFVTEAGNLGSMTFIKNEEVLSWAQHPVTSTVVESVAVVPQTTTDTDDVWISGKITVNSVESRYIGYFDPTVKMDWALTATGAAASTFIGADHLEGETVVINGDAAVYSPRVVSSGAITLTDTETPISTIQTGLAFTPMVIPLPPEIPLPNGPSYGAKKRYSKILIFAQDTMSLSVNGEKHEPRVPGDMMDAAPAFTGTQIFQYTSLGAMEIPQLIITQPLPLDIDVLSIYGEVEIE